MDNRKVRLSIELAMMLVTTVGITSVVHLPVFGQGKRTTLRSPMPTVRPGAASATMREKVYILGGITREGKSSSVVEEYDTLTDRWSRKASMPTPRMMATAAVFDEMIYILGGSNENGVADAVEAYNPVSNSWKKMKPMPFGRWNHMVAVVGGKIYVLGGLIGTGNKRESIDKVEIYDPATDSWSNGYPMPKPKRGAAVAVLEGKIYVLGGMIGSGGLGGSVTNAAEVYDLSTGTWSTVKPMQIARTDAEAAVVDGKIYVVGGGIGGRATDTIEVYDPATDSWETKFFLQNPRTMHSIASVGNKIFIIGGAVEPSPSGFVGVVEELSLKN